MTGFGESRMTLATSRTAGRGTCIFISIQHILCQHDRRPVEIPHFCPVNFLDKRLRPTERLKSRVAIEAAFKGGASVKAYPLLLVYRRLTPNETIAPARMGFVAPKKAFRRAHDRNHVKRRMRESYRLQKVPFYTWLRERGVALEGLLIFTGRELPDQATLDQAWRKLRRRFTEISFEPLPVDDPLSPPSSVSAPAL